MTLHYCSYFDERYLPRGLAMIRSLHCFEPEAMVWVLCLTDACHAALAALAEPNVRPVRISEFEARDAALATARSNRNLIEYYFTCTPSLVLYVMNRADDGDIVTYVDGDLFFFSSPAPLRTALDHASVTIIEHRFPDRLRKLEAFGRFNVGWLGFKVDAEGKRVATWWRERCNDWCYDRLEGDRFADQGYLNSFEGLSTAVKVLSHPGANLAPWNLGRHRVSLRDATVLVDGQPLIFFHFHGLKQAGPATFLASHVPYRAPFHGLIRTHIYQPYAAALLAAGRDAARHLANLPRRTLKRDDSGKPKGLAALRAALSQHWRALSPYLFLHIVRPRSSDR